MTEPGREPAAGTSPVGQFAFWLAQLRRESSLSLQQLADRTHYARSTLSEAISGRALPSRDVVLAIVDACGGDAPVWEQYWLAVKRSMAPHAPPELRRVSAPPEITKLADQGPPAGDPPPLSSPPAVTTKDESRPAQKIAPSRRRRRGLLLAGMLLVALAAASIGGWAAHRAAAPMPIGGRVVCSDGSAIVGVWVVAVDSGSGFATWVPVPGRPSSLDYEYTLPHRQRWTVHVGCGGTPQQWARQARGATTVATTRQNWTCYPASRPSDSYCTAA